MWLAGRASSPERVTAEVRARCKNVKIMLKHENRIIAHDLNTQVMMRHPHDIELGRITSNWAV